MQLEDCFEFETFDTKFGPVERIRIKDHRIAIEHVIELYNQGVTAEKIIELSFPSLTLAEVYATITYYLHNQDRVDEYIRKNWDYSETFYQDYLQQEPSPVVKRLRALKEERSREKRERIEELAELVKKHG